MTRALALRSRTIAMGAQRLGGRARVPKPRTKRPRLGQMPSTGMPMEPQMGRRARQQSRKRPPSPSRDCQPVSSPVARMRSKRSLVALS